MRTWEACVGKGAGAGVSGLHVSVVEEDDQWHPSVREDWRKSRIVLVGRGGRLGVVVGEGWNVVVSVSARLAWWVKRLAG